MCFVEQSPLGRRASTFILKASPLGQGVFPVVHKTIPKVRKPGHKGKIVFSDVRVQRYNVPKYFPKGNRPGTLELCFGFLGKKDNSKVQNDNSLRNDRDSL